jgi:hypothetical protein
MNRSIIYNSKGGNICVLVAIPRVFLQQQKKKIIISITKQTSSPFCATDAINPIQHSRTLMYMVLSVIERGEIRS